MDIKIASNGDLNITGNVLFNDGPVKCQEKEGAFCNTACSKFQGIRQYDGTVDRFRTAAGLKFCHGWILFKGEISFKDQRNSKANS